MCTTMRLVVQLPCCRIGTESSQPTGDEADVWIEHGVPPGCTCHTSIGLMHQCGGMVGSNVRWPVGEGIYPRPRIVSQPTGRGCYGNETQRSFGQHDHENRLVDVSDVPHLHPFTDWDPFHGSGLENVVTVHVSKRRIILKSGRFCATTAVYDGLEILCALAPNTGFK